MPHIMNRFETVDGIEIFYRESGPANAPLMLLLHGFPSSSIQFRYLPWELSDQWRLIAPDLPGFGFSAVPDSRAYEYSFSNFAVTLKKFLTQLKLNPQALYLHDYGAQAGFYLLTSGAAHPQGIVIQNSEAYYAEGRTNASKNAEALWQEPSKANEDKLRNELFDESGIRREFVEDLPQEIVERIDPAIIRLAIDHMNRPGVIDAMLALHHDYKNNVDHYENIQRYFREHQLPALVLWGQGDQYYTSEQAYAFKKDLPEAQVEVMDGGHWLLESHSEEVGALTRDFLSQVGTLRGEGYVIE